MLVTLGVVAAGTCATGLVWLAWRPGAVTRWPIYGTVGVVAMGAFELMLALRVAWVTTFFTALIWTVYIVAMDGAVYRRRGDSLLHHGCSLVGMALLSVPAWLIFEAYNLRLANWDYVDVPRYFWVFALGAGWAFATIFAGIFETADLVHCAWAERLRCRPWRRRRGEVWTTTGIILLALPLVLSRGIAVYLFALVWVGFIFLLEPVQRRLGWPSVLADLEAGLPGRAVALLIGGGVCGFFWEFWNFWAAARWEYIFPILHRYRVFAMPAPGFLGFPPFALECFSLYIISSHALLPPEWRAGVCDSLNPRVPKEDNCPRARM